MAQHVFVAMPFGLKEGINFDRVYVELIRPALTGEGFEIIRADQELRAGDIRVDMFQELLLADLVVVDLSIDNPNVWYELGVRHALRKRGVVQIQGRRNYLPFDVYVDRAVHYHLKDVGPDPEYLQTDIKHLATFARETMSAWYGRPASPVYQLLRFLQEPDWKSLRSEDARALWEPHEAWVSRIRVARKRHRPGDIVTLAEEAPSRALTLEARRTAGKELRALGHFNLALYQIEKALLVDPTDLASQLEKGILLGRLGRQDEAKELLRRVVGDHPSDAESWATLGRVEKDEWINAWRQAGASLEEQRNLAPKRTPLLRRAIETYSKGFRADARHYYSGINALMLLHLLRHLCGDEIAGPATEMEGGIRWAIQSSLSQNSLDYWALVTRGDLEVLVGGSAVIERAYREAAEVAIADNDWFALDSPRQQLHLLKDLGFRPTEVDAALQVFDEAVSRLPQPLKPRLVFLFSGHMIDDPMRPKPRFPSDKEPDVAREIAEKLDELGAGPEDLALCSGACGGDLLFTEACLKRGLRLELRLPFPEAEFLRKSVSFAGEAWTRRYYSAKAAIQEQNSKVFVLPDELGPLPKEMDAFSRNNVWLLNTALAWGPERIRFLCLWDGEAGDGPGGTKHMHETVSNYLGQVYVLNRLWRKSS